MKFIFLLSLSLCFSSLSWAGQKVLVLSEASDNDTASLLRKLESSNADERGGALYELGRLKVASAVPKILSIAFRDHDRMVRTNAIQALFKIEGEKAVPKLRPLLKDKDARLSEGLAVTLAYYKDRAALPVLKRALRRTKDEDDFEIALMLAELGDRSGTNALLSDIEKPLHKSSAIPDTPPSAIISRKQKELTSLASLYRGTKSRKMTKRLERLLSREDLAFLHNSIREALAVISGVAKQP